jgi:sulfur carrier protein
VLESEENLVLVNVNGEATGIRLGSTVRELLAHLGMAGRRVAVAINREVVPRSLYDKVELSADDRVEILEAVGGG